MIVHKATQPIFGANGNLRKIVQVELIDHQNVLDQRMTQNELSNLLTNLVAFWEVSPGIIIGEGNENQPVGYRINQNDFDQIIRIFRIGQYTRYAAQNIRAILALTMTSSHTDQGQYQICETTINLICDVMPR